MEHELRAGNLDAWNAVFNLLAIAVRRRSVFVVGVHQATLWTEVLAFLELVGVLGPGSIVSLRGTFWTAGKRLPNAMIFAQRGTQVDLPRLGFSETPQRIDHDYVGRMFGFGDCSGKVNANWMVTVALARMPSETLMNFGCDETTLPSELRGLLVSLRQIKVMILRLGALADVLQNGDGSIFVVSHQPVQVPFSSAHREFV